MLASSLFAGDLLNKAEVLKITSNKTHELTKKGKKQRMYHSDEGFYIGMTETGRPFSGYWKVNDKGQICLDRLRNKGKKWSCLYVARNSDGTHEKVRVNDYWQQTPVLKIDKVRDGNPYQL